MVDEEIRYPVRVVAWDLELELLLLRHRLRRYNLRKALQPWRLQPRRGICLQRCNYPWLGDLVRSAVLHIHGGKEKYVTLLGDPRGDRLHNFTIDGLLVIRD